MAIETRRSTVASLRALTRDLDCPNLELAIIVPTFNERDNVPVLLDRLAAALEGIVYEVIFVDDDSPDGTAEAARQIALREPHVRVIRRIGRRGCEASACLEGMMATAAPYVAVMDGDLRHDETILPAMLSRARDGGCDVVVGEPQRRRREYGRVCRRSACA